MNRPQVARLRFRSVAILGVAAMLNGCANQPQQATGQQVGVVLGAVIGAVLGSTPNSRAAGAAIGAFVGGAVGGAIGRHLDDVDRLKAQVAAQAAVRQPNSAVVSWASDKNPGVSGVVTTSAPVATTQGQCKNVTHIVNVNGREHREENRMCQKADGSWALA
jgi:surface antigen